MSESATSRWLVRTDRAAQDPAHSTEIAQFAARALATECLDEILDDAVRVAAAVLRVPLVSMFTLIDGDELFWAAGVGWSPGLVRQMSVPAREGSLCSLALADESVAQSADFAEETRFPINQALVDNGAASGLAMPLVLRGTPYGTLTVFDTEPRVYSAAEATSLSLLGSIVAAAVARAESDAALLRQVMRDPLTGLANRALFHDRASRSLLRSTSRSMVAVILADIDAFKLVNDTHGHSVGDELLAAVAPRLAAALPPGATVARLGGDEFVVCVEDLRDAEHAYAIGTHVSNAIGGRVVLGGRELLVSASVGVAVTGRPQVTSGELLRQADVAMYRAKELGRGRVEIFDTRLRARVADRLLLEAELMGAAERDEFTLAYQPIVGLGDGQAHGFEVLLRWPRRVGATCSPATFVPVLEECGLINSVGRRTLLTAAHQLARWQKEFGAPLHLAVNASAHQLGRPELLEAVQEAIAAGLAPGSLYIEVTETALVQEARGVRAYLEQLRAAGARIVLDDFGTGYSSLSHLIDFPLDMLKIDRSFVAGLGKHIEQTAIVESVIALAHKLSLTVVAEGIETDEQRRLVTEMGCDFGQGYLWAKAMPPDQVGSFLAAQLFSVPAKSA